MDPTDRRVMHPVGSDRAHSSGMRDGSPVVLECRGLRKRFGDVAAVSDVGFVVRAGETYGLLGPNGAGKTTTISMICGLLAADDGDVFVDGQQLLPSLEIQDHLDGRLGSVPEPVREA
ncbi:MAG: ATP-binding cassette domain-containing protein [Actinomycetota bacterium]|nr:ATP-binding cassette domain-containing protein [Actinomycetota bacterium]